MARCIAEPAKDIPVVREADLCVIGGSCTGLFAAVRAARMGLKVVLVERMGILGGVATAGLVNIWHTFYDTSHTQQVIAGLSEEVYTVLEKRGAAFTEDHGAYQHIINPVELTMVLDDLVCQHRIDVMLHTLFVDTVREGDAVKAVLVENNDGRGAILADFFIDATGDGFVARSLGLTSFAHEYIQPPTACFFLQGNMDGLDLQKMVQDHGSEFGLDDDWGWDTVVAGLDGISMRADQHVFGFRCDRADDLTQAEMEGRKQVSGFLGLLRTYGRKDTRYAPVNLCSSLGLRETVHYHTRFQASELPLLTGTCYDAPIMNGTYPIDIHHASGGGITFRRLPGDEETIFGKGTRREVGNWRERMGLTGEPARYYQIPFDILVADTWKNFIPVGRMLNADMSAYGALRVMVNLNQMGEAAGTAAALCLDASLPVQQLDGKRVTQALRKGGSAV